MAGSEVFALRWAGSTVNISPTQVADFLRSPEGPVLRRFMILGERVKVQTQLSLRAGFPRDFLGPQIVKRVVMASNGPHVIVGADHTRTEPHLIQGNPLLVFFWPKVGRTMFLRQVNHPGSDFSEYLIRKLTESMATLRGAI